MRKVRFVSISLVLLVGVAPARASSGLLVDAGPTIVASVDVPFHLDAAVEDAGGPVTLHWSAPADCAIAEPTHAVTTATCTQPGTHQISLEATDGMTIATDRVAAVTIFRETVSIRRAGTVGAGIPDEITPGSGTIDGGNATTTFIIPTHTTRLTATLDWGLEQNDLDLVLTDPHGDGTRLSRRYVAKPEIVEDVVVPAGEWTATIEAKINAPDEWTLEIEADREIGAVSLPTVIVPAARAEPDDDVTLTARPAGGTPPYAFAWETDPLSARFDDGAGDSFELTFTTPTALRVRITDANGFQAVSTAFVWQRGVNEPRPLTVVAVVDDSFTPYHVDFLGSHHPWNTDTDGSNDFDFSADPVSYLDGYPGAIPLHVTLPTGDDEQVSGRANGVDAAVFSSMRRSTSSDVTMYRFPETKIVGAVNFDGWVGGNSSHGTRSAASAVGNIHGTCPECLVVMLTGAGGAGLRWAAAQEWIDVVTNSYGHSTTGVVRDNIYFGAPIEATRAASEAGQTIVFSAGNGLLNAFDVPPLTYWSSEKGTDWTITVGAVTPSTKQTYTGHGKPVDISSIGTSYPSSGGTTAAGTGTHSGTSNAAPVTAGLIAKTIQRARELLGDLTSTHANGVVASGAPVPCGAHDPTCPLGDGVLTLRELHDTVLRSAEPSPQVLLAGGIPTTEHSYYYQGHGVVLGRIDGDDAYEAEWRRTASMLTGTVPPPSRGAAAERWFVVDSFCRQRLWGTWSSGRYATSLPALDPVADPVATPFASWCSQIPEGTFAELG